MSARYGGATTRRAALGRVVAIRSELERLTTRRAELWQEADASGDPSHAESIDDLSERIDLLWSNYRSLRGAVENGSHASILRHADREARLERDLSRRTR